LNDYLGGVKTEKMKTLLFVGSKIEAFESTVYKGREAVKFSVLFG